MENKPLISVIMSAYNAEKFVGESIESILNQTFHDFEFIIFDDGSTDNTRKIIKRYALHDNRIVPIFNKENRGYAGFIRNLNKGLQLAKGNYVARMDADDVSLSNRLIVQYNFLEKNKSIFLVGAAAIFIDEKGEKIVSLPVITGFNNIKSRILKRNCLFHPTIMFRNEKIVNYREKALYCEDYDLYLQLISKRKRLDNINLPLIKYRIYSDSISIKKSFYQELFAKKVREINLKNINERKDQYELFNPESILKMRFNKNKEKFFIKNFMTYLFGTSKTKKIRSKCLNYFRKYGIFNKMLGYYLLSFLPLKIQKWMSNLFRR